ncbi:beta-ketoacyl synthase N-terminal-like domain-containing protein, partial [Porphyromonas sp. CAG:1061]
MELKRVVVTGLGAISPLGSNLASTWEGMKAGRSGAAPITLWDASKHKTQFACEVKGFDPAEHFDRKEARKFDRYTMFALVSAEEALKDSGLDLESADKNRIGVIFTSGVGGIKTFEDEMLDYNPERGPRFNPFFIPKMIADMAAGH